MSHPKVEMYFKPFCPYCIRARALLAGKLESRGAKLVEYNAFADPAHRKDMLQRANGGRTYPQIFINGEHVGGSDDVHALDRAGKLDALLDA